MFILRPSLTLNFGFVLGLWVLFYGANEIIIKLRIKPREKKKKDFAWEIVQGKRQQNLGFLVELQSGGGSMEWYPVKTSLLSRPP